MKNPNKKLKGVTIGQSRYKLSSLVFGVVIVIGLVWAGVGALTNKENKAATNSFENIIAIPSWWYSDHFGSSVCESENCQMDADPDGDKLTNKQEYYYHSDPNNKDTNGNGLTDGEDVAFGYAPDKPGKITFEQAASDDNIVGESLLFDSEVKELIVDMTDFSKILLPEVADSELTIIETNSYQSFVDYMLALDVVSKKYYTGPDMFKNLGEQIKQQNKSVIQDMKVMALKVREDYRKVPVPREAVQLHKYHLALWGILPSVLELPGQGATGMQALTDVAANKWYDHAQAMIALNQKMEIEIQKMRNKYEK